MQALPLSIAAAGSGGDPLVEAANEDRAQAQYLRWYLADLGAAAVVVEPHYFDRDYLSEFAAFYCTSSAGYPNTCRRAHYFAHEIDRELLLRACSGDLDALGTLQNAYLGFVVLRPIPGAPLGRTVVRWYPDQTPHLPRVVTPSRNYESNLAGFTLTVRGLAWQQQDTGVGACATVALWSMLQSSAFDDRHVVPTTAEITQTAHRAGLSGDRIYPSGGLSFGQLIATVRDSGFAPLVIAADRKRHDATRHGFGREHFCSAVASFIRSGFPILMSGEYVEREKQVPVGSHAVCVVGFRQAASTLLGARQVEFEDAHTEHIYIHDDNLGPAARFRIEVVGDEANGYVRIVADPPLKQHGLELADPTERHPYFVPTALLAAAHEDVRTSPDQTNAIALELGAALAHLGETYGLTVGSRVVRLTEYVGPVLAGVLQNRADDLAKTRMALWEHVPPMSRHLALVRYAIGGEPVLDVLFDTTDTVVNTAAFCCVAYNEELASSVEALAPVARAVGLPPLGILVRAFHAT